MVGPTGKGKEKEQPKERRKPGRIPTSCAECRRLKLKCDKNIPCSKCVSRGCGSICPEGSLTPGKGNRLVLANTEELHDKIDLMASRNRELENALRELQKRVSEEPHPLLKTDLLSINFLQGSSSRASSSSTTPKSPIGAVGSPSIRPNPLDSENLYEDEGSAQLLGTLYLDRRGQARHFGRTARPEYLIRSSSDPTDTSHPQISPSILRLAFPETQAIDPAIPSTLFSSLPPRNEARRLWELYTEYGLYLYHPISEQDLPEYLFTAVDHPRPQEYLDDLALFYIIFAIGALFDTDTRTPHHASTSAANGYYALSRASLNLSQQARNYTLRTIQTMIHMVQYLELTDTSPVGSDNLWLDLGNAVRLSQNIGLHLDSTFWKLPDDLVERRHELFWNLFVVDTWASINAGKPPSILKSHVNCPYPRRHRSALAAGETTIDYHVWHTELTVLVHNAAEVAMGPRKPVYSFVLGFDRLIRDLDVPASWRMPPPDMESSLPTAEIAVYRWLVLSSKEIAILNLHKPYLATALQEMPADLQRHRYLPSVIASYKGAWRIMRAFAMTSRLSSEFLTRVGIAWSHAMSAAIVMSLIITKAPTSPWASPALDEIDNLASLFHSATELCSATANLYPTLEALRLKAHDVIGDPHVRSHYLQDGRTMATAEVERLGGQTQLVPEHVSSSLAPSRAPSRATSTTISEMADIQHTHPSSTSNRTPSSHKSPTARSELDGIHPSLAKEAEMFRTHGNLGAGLGVQMTFHDLPAPLHVQPPPPPQHTSYRPLRPSSASPTTSQPPIYPTMMAPPASAPGPSSVSAMSPSHTSAQSSGHHLTPTHTHRSTQLPQMRVPKDQEYYPPYTPSTSTYTSTSYATSTVRESSIPSTSGFGSTSSHQYTTLPASTPSSSGYNPNSFASQFAQHQHQQPQPYIPPPLTPLPPGFQPIFQTHNWLTPSPLALDSSWSPFVEQLGYC